MMDWTEVFGAATGLLYVILEIRQKRSMWIVGAISALIYMAVFFTSALYAAMGLQVYYLVVSVYGWQKWGIKSPDENSNREVVVGMKYNLLLISSLVSLVCYFGLTWVLENYTGDPNPRLDAFITTISMLATYWVTKKHIEHWFLWIIADALAVFLYIQQGLYATTALYVIYIAAAVAGYLHWRKFPRVLN